MRLSAEGSEATANWMLLGVFQSLQLHGGDFSGGMCCEARIHTLISAQVFGSTAGVKALTRRARGSFFLKVALAQLGRPSRTPRLAGDGAFPRSTPCSMSLQLKSMPPML